VPPIPPNCSCSYPSSLLIVSIRTPHMLIDSPSDMHGRPYRSSQSIQHPPWISHVIRNAGASAKDALRSILISQQLLGTKEILLIKHTGCGMLSFKNEDAYKVVEGNLGEEVGGKLREEGFDFLPFGSLEEETKRDVQWLRGNDLVVKGEDGERKVSGWVYEVETGKVRKVA